MLHTVQQARKQKKLGCQRVYAVSQENSQQIILFGIDKLTSIKPSN